MTSYLLALVSLASVILANNKFWVCLLPLLFVAVLCLTRFLLRLNENRPTAVGDTKTASPYRPRHPFLTPAERSFFGVLQQALNADYHVFAKVRLADIVQPAASPSRSGWQSAFNRITSKHVDFVLCDRSTVNVAAVIELDDRTHLTLEAGFRDDLVDIALRDANIPILRVPARSSYSPVQLREEVTRAVRPRSLKSETPETLKVA
jgi:hypothetical protein